MPKSNMWIWITLSIVVLMFVGLFYSVRNTAASNDINGIKCSTMEGQAMHIHSNLIIIENGIQTSPPSNIGIRSNQCLFWLHTHTADGILHIESPTIRDFYLRDFMAVWKGVNPSTYLLETQNVTAVYVNGKPYEGNYGDIKFENKQNIVLVVGEYNGPIPVFAWPSNY